MRPLDDHQLRTLLAEVDEHQVDEREQHQLMVLFRHHGPTPSGVKQWLGRLFEAVLPEPVAVRSAVEQKVLEVEAGPYSVMLEVRPTTPGGSFDLHGQIFADELQAENGSVVLSKSDTEVFSGPIDEYGEFDLRGVPAGHYRATWHLSEARIVVDDMHLEGMDGDQ